MTSAPASAAVTSAPASAAVTSSPASAAVTPAPAPPTSLLDALRDRAPVTTGTTSPWALHEQVRLAQSVTLGFVTLGVGWFVLSGTVSLRRQEIFLVVGLAGVLVSSAGIAVWLLSGLRAVRTRRVAVRRAMALVASSAPAAAPQAMAVEEAGVGLVASSAMTHYHVPACLLVEDKDVSSLSELDHVRAGRAACPVCLA